MIIKVYNPGEVKRTEMGEMEVLDYHIIRYPSGKIFVQYLYKDLLEHLADDMRKNLKKGYDNVVATEGAEGSGKSNLAWQLLRRYDPDFDFQEQYVYSMEEFRAKLQDGDDSHSAFWMDEASYIANNREWQSQQNRDLVSLLEMMRSRGWTIDLCIPTVERLDVYIREHRIRYILRCIPAIFENVGGYKERGYFELLRRDASGKIIHIGYGMFDPMPSEIKEEYEKRKLESQQRKISEVVDQQGAGARYKKMYEDERKRSGVAMLRLRELGVEDGELMEMFGYTNPHTFANALSKARKNGNQE